MSGPRCWVCADYTVPDTAPPHDWRRCPRLQHDPEAWRETADRCTYPKARNRYGIGVCGEPIYPNSGGKCSMWDRHLRLDDRAHLPGCRTQDKFEPTPTCSHQCPSYDEYLDAARLAGSHALGCPALDDDPDGIDRCECDPEVGEVPS